jgi:hypothetical protein
MQRDIQSKTRTLNVILFYLHLYPPARKQKEVLRTVHHRWCKCRATPRIGWSSRNLLKERSRFTEQQNPAGSHVIPHANTLTACQLFGSAQEMRDGHWQQMARPDLCYLLPRYSSINHLHREVPTGLCRVPRA